MAAMTTVDWLELRASRPYILLTIVGVVVGVGAWFRLLTTDGTMPRVAVVYVVVHLLVIMIGCLMTPLLASSRPPRCLGLLPVLEIPVLLIGWLVAALLGRVPPDRTMPALLVVPAAQVAVLVGGLVAQQVLVRVIRRLSSALARSGGRSERQATVGVLLVGTVTGVVLLVAGTMLAGVAPEGTGMRGALLRAAVTALMDFSGDRQGWAWVGRVGLALFVLSAAPLAFARR